MFFKEHLGGNKFNSIVSNHHIIILSCCVRNETTRKMKIDEVESTTKKARVATHTHIKVLFFTNTSSSSSLSLSRRAINAQNQSCCGSMMRSIVIGDAFFFSLSLTRLIFSFSARRNECLRETHDRVSG